MKFGEFIKKERIKKSILQRELAAKLDIDTAYISKIENNEKLPKKQLAIEFGKVLGINLKFVETYWLKQKLMNQLVGEQYSINAIKLILKEFKENKD